MKLNQPVKTLAPHTQITKGKYAEVYVAIERLRGGEWLPVEFENPHDAYNFRVAASTNRKRKLETALRGNVVYVRGKTGSAPATNGTKGKVVR